MPLIGFFRSLSCLYSWNAWQMPRTCASSRSVTWVPTTTAPDHAALAASPDRDHRLDEVAGCRARGRW